MATVFAPPAELPVPVVDYKNYDFEKEEAAEEAWVEKLANYCRTHGNGALAGKEIRHQVADGYARYMVLKEKPFQMIHLPLGDCYDAGAIWERGIRLTDARKMVEREERLAELFAKRKEEVEA